MRYSVAIAGEAWESVFAAATGSTLAGWISPDVELWAPAEFSGALQGVRGAVHFVPPSHPGFQSYSDVRERLLAVAGERVLLLAAGVLPGKQQPIENLGSPLHQDRHVEWISTDSGPTIIHFHQPPHRPPARPQHRATQEGALAFWEVDGGLSYYSGLLSLEHRRSAPVFRPYGRGVPLFAYNTNRFDEPGVGAHEQYVILASGLLGLRLVMESHPPQGARVIVYDINPDQIAWIQFLLDRAGMIADFEEVLHRFTAAHPSIAVRQVQPHEKHNAASQVEWYAQNHLRLSGIAQHLRWEFVVCDLLTEPLTLIEKLDPLRSTMLMYLDVFLIWNIETDSPWIEHHIGMARSLEALLRDTIFRPVSFVPGERSCRFQFCSESPFHRCQA